MNVNYLFPIIFSQIIAYVILVMNSWTHRKYMVSIRSIKKRCKTLQKKVGISLLKK